MTSLTQKAAPMTRAQKAAVKILDCADNTLVSDTMKVWRQKRINSYTSIIQQSITEAVDAAVAPKEKRVKELEAALQALKHWSQLYIDGDLSLSDIEDAIEKAAAALEAPHEP